MSKLVFEHVHRILCLGAHPDDIEIGCGGTILRLLSEHDVVVHWVVFSGNPIRAEESRRSADEFLRNAKSKNVVQHDFRDSFFPSQWEDIKVSISDIASQFDPDLVFTHNLEDRHQDHKVIAELTWNHFRNQTVLEYEIPKFEGDLHTPNFYVGLAESMCSRKVELLDQSFVSQQNKPWFDSRTFWAMLRMRGVESGLSSEFAEGFHARKLAI